MRETADLPIVSVVGFPQRDGNAIFNAKIGTCTVTQDFVFDFTGPEPAIRDYKVGQAIE